MEVKSHAKYSASGSKRWLTCPASISLSEGIPNRESAAAKYGTDAHTCLEVLLKSERMSSAMTVLNKAYPEEMVWHAYEAAKFIKARAFLNGGTLLVEERVSLECVGPDMFGTVDAAIIEPFDKLTVIDFKYGVSPVDPKENTQLIYYALGLAKLYDFSFGEIELIVIQPRASVNGETIRCWSISPQDLANWIEIFADARRACEDFIAPTVIGDHCFFCPAKLTTCPEHLSKQVERAVQDFEGL